MKYKCVGGHDLCHTMLPCKECPYCEREIDMTKYQEQFSVSLSLSEWLRVNIALFDAVEHYRECRNYPQTAKETRDVLDKIRSATQTDLEKCHQEVLSQLGPSIKPAPEPEQVEGEYLSMWHEIGGKCPTCKTTDPYGHEAGCVWLHETPWIKDKKIVDIEVQF